MSSVNLQRRTFLAQAGAGAAVLTAGSLLSTANASAAQTGQGGAGRHRRRRVRRGVVSGPATRGLSSRSPCSSKPAGNR